MTGSRQNKSITCVEVHITYSKFSIKLQKQTIAAAIKFFLSSMYIFYLADSLVESHFNLKAEKCVLKEMKELYI